MSFFDRIIVKMVKKPISDKPIDLEKMSKRTEFIGSLSLFLFFIALPFGYFSFYITLITLAFSVIVGIITPFIAKKVLANPDATIEQKKMAKRGRRRGIFSVIISILLPLLIYILTLATH
jgi:hypothetical protein